MTNHTRTQTRGSTFVWIRILFKWSFNIEARSPQRADLLHGAQSHHEVASVYAEGGHDVALQPRVRDSTEGRTAKQAKVKKKSNRGDAASDRETPGARTDWISTLSRMSSHWDGPVPIAAPISKYV